MMVLGSAVVDDIVSPAPPLFLSQSILSVLVVVDELDGDIEVKSMEVLPFDDSNPNPNPSEVED